MSGPALSPEGERSLIIDYHLGLPIADLAETYGIHRATIYRIIERHGVKTERKRR